MCHFERTHFRCAHSETHRIAHCHFARNEPLHVCSGVQVMKKERWAAAEDCENCRKQHLYAQGNYAAGYQAGYNGFGRG